MGQEQGRVLVVDDDGADREYFVSTLRGAGYDVVALASGEEALELARRELPSLVLLDVSLPGLSGYEVCVELKDRFGAALPIVFVSRSRTESYDRAAGLLVGGDDYLVKPVAPEELLIRVAHLVERAAEATADKLTAA